MTRRGRNGIVAWWHDTGNVADLWRAHGAAVPGRWRERTIAWRLDAGEVADDFSVDQETGLEEY